MGRRPGPQDPARESPPGRGRIRRRATTYGYSPAERAGADECARYLENKQDYLDYATALAKGWPIATGIIEGACRHIVKDRMDITGARWGLEGAEAILKLRALIATGDFEDYWRFHLRREHERIHHARYRDSHSSQRNQLTSKEPHPVGILILAIFALVIALEATGRVEFRGRLKRRRNTQKVWHPYGSTEPGFPGSTRRWRSIAAWIPDGQRLSPEYSTDRRLRAC